MNSGQIQFFATRTKLLVRLNRFCPPFILVMKGNNELNQVFFQQLAGIFQIPWGHHCLIMDKLKGDYTKSLFYVRKNIEHGWSRAMLLNFLDTNLYEREGKCKH